MDVCSGLFLKETRSDSVTRLQQCYMTLGIASGVE